MNIKRRIKLGNNKYYISFECEYIKENDINKLCLRNYVDNYFDSGNLSNLIKKIENNYDESIYKRYGDEILFLSDCLYIYDNIPFIDGIGDYSDINSSYISREELNKYIAENNIVMNNNKNFKLYDERTW